MVAVVACVSQKGGVAKSALARLVAREYAMRGKKVLLADLDTFQSTSTEWAARRLASQTAPIFPVQEFESVKKALKAGAGADLLILDARGFADQQTIDVAKAADIVLLPTGLSVDDLRPSVRLAHELAAAGIPRGHLLFALCRTGDSAREIAEARLFLEQAGYACLRPVWPERAGYRHAHDEGRTGTEARHPSLKAKAEIFAKTLSQAIDRCIKEKTT